MTTKSNIKAISLFSGAGGFDIASLMADVPVISQIDNEEDCIETLKINDHFNDSIILNEDLIEFDNSNFEDILSQNTYSKFIVIGGAPCQPFSKAGYWVGEGNRLGIEDPKARLVNEYLKVIADLNPDGFVFENVASLLHKNNKAIVDQFIETIKKLGYNHKVIKAIATDYGVPQKRRRMFIIGTKGNFKSDQPQKTHCSKDESDKNELSPYVTVGEAIKKFNTDKYYEEYEDTTGGKYSEELREVPPGKNYKALTEWAGHPDPKFEADKRFWNFLLKLSPDLPSWTITAQPGTWTGPFHWTSRRLRVPEIAALQSFPEEYNFHGSRRSIQRQIGNAVPPLMGKAMIEYLKESLI